MKKHSPQPQNEAPHHLVKQYGKMVHSIAHKIKRNLAEHIELSDLVEYGMVGLMEANQRFDSKLGHHFSTFAYHRIRGAIFDGLRGMGWLNRRDYQRAQFEAKANGLLAELFYQNPELPGGNDKVAMLEHQVQQLTQAMGQLSLVYVTQLDANLEESLMANHVDNIDEAFSQSQMRLEVKKHLKKLAPDEQYLVELYYYQERTLEQVGKKLGLSKSWTSRLHARVIDKLQRFMEKT